MKRNESQQAGVSHDSEVDAIAADLIRQGESPSKAVAVARRQVEARLREQCQGGWVGKGDSGIEAHYQ